jgi:hypothetical protein
LTLPTNNHEYEKLERQKMVDKVEDPKLLKKELDSEADLYKAGKRVQCNYRNLLYI